MNGTVTSITGFTILYDKDDTSRKSSDVNKYNMGPEDLAAVIARAERGKKFEEPQKRPYCYERIPVRKKKTKSKKQIGAR